MPLFLTSAAFSGLGAWLDARGAQGPVLVITSASRALADGDAIVTEALTALAAATRPALTLDLAEADPAPLAALAAGPRYAAGESDAPGAVVMTGGDPFALLAALNGTGAADLLRAAHHRGVPIAGQSAGAMVCGPTLEPIRLTSPFSAPAGLDLTALHLTEHLVLPHHDRAGRSARHREAAARFRDSVTLTPVWDDEALLLAPGGEPDWQLARGDTRTRVATSRDAAAVADLFHAAARRAWASFLGDDRLAAAAAAADVNQWAARIDEAGAGFLITEDPSGVCGFVHYRRLADTALGEVDLLYTHPRTWGAGIGRRLLERATWNLFCLGCTEAVLWTEERNERALAVYAANGWRADGAVAVRDYLGVPIRNRRLRLALNRHAGGA